MSTTSRLARRLRRRPGERETNHWGAGGDRHVRLGGWVATVHRYMRAGLLDELHVAVVPALLGGSDRPFDGLGDVVGDWTWGEFAPSASVTHVRLRRR